MVRAWKPVCHCSIAIAMPISVFAEFFLAIYDIIPFRYYVLTLPSNEKRKVDERKKTKTRGNKRESREKWER